MILTWCQVYKKNTIVNNFMVNYLDLTKCQGDFAWGIILLGVIAYTFYSTFYHSLPPNVLLQIVKTRIFSP
jgi:hypothetical protein